VLPLRRRSPTAVSRETTPSSPFDATERPALHADSTSVHRRGARRLGGPGVPVHTRSAQLPDESVSSAAPVARRRTALTMPCRATCPDSGTPTPVPRETARDSLAGQPSSRLVVRGPIGPALGPVRRGTSRQPNTRATHRSGTPQDGSVSTSMTTARGPHAAKETVLCHRQATGSATSSPGVAVPDVSPPRVRGWPTGPLFRAPADEESTPPGSRT
jgi:hypothetical protein